MEQLNSNINAGEARTAQHINCNMKTASRGNKAVFRDHITSLHETSTSRSRNAGNKALSASRKTYSCVQTTIPNKSRICNINSSDDKLEVHAYRRHVPSQLNSCIVKFCCPREPSRESPASKKFL